MKYDIDTWQCLNSSLFYANAESHSIYMGTADKASTLYAIDFAKANRTRNQMKQ